MLMAGSSAVGPLFWQVNEAVQQLTSLHVRLGNMELDYSMIALKSEMKAVVHFSISGGGSMDSSSLFSIHIVGPLHPCVNPA